MTRRKEIRTIKDNNDNKQYADETKTLATLLYNLQNKQ